MDAHGVQPTTWSNLAAHQEFPGQEGLFILSLVMGARKFSTSCFFFLNDDLKKFQFQQI